MINPRHPSLFTRKGIVHHSRKLWVLLILSSFLGLNSGCNESGMPSSVLVLEITSTTPEANAFSVPVDTSISVTFNEEIEPTSIHGDSFLLKNETDTIAGTFSYSDLTAVFTPSTSLGHEGNYSVLISSAVESLSGTNLAEDHEWSFTTEEWPSSAVPQVISTNPANNAADVLPNSAVMASFNKPINSNSLNTTTFTVFQENTPISGLVTSSTSTATFSPFSVLSTGSTYRAVISKDVVDTLGNNLESDFEWSFTITQDSETSAPSVQSIDPTDEEIDVPVDAVISANFSKNLDDASVNSSTFRVSQNGNSVSGNIEVSGSTISFTPNSALSYESEVSVILTAEIKGEDGNNLSADFEWSFLTMNETDITPPEVQSVSPSDAAKDVSVDAVISANFSKKLHDASVNSSTFMVSQNGNSVSGNIEVSSSTISFTPNSALAYGTEVSVILTTEIKDEDGKNISADYEWSFVTLDKPDTTPPHIWSVNPTDESINVPIDVVISAGFSKVLDNASVTSSVFLVTQNGESVSGDVSLSDSTLSFSPNTDLLYNADIFVVVTSGVKDEAGNNLPHDYEWTFVTMGEPDTISPTIISTSPAANERDIDVNPVISATFSEPMNESTIGTSTIIVSRENNTVPGSVSYSDNTVRFTPNEDLHEKRTYTVTITTGVEDVAGNALESDLIWTFLTERDDDDDDDD